MIEEKNAKITGTFLGFEDHGFFTFMLHLDCGGSGQSAGTYCLDHSKWDESKQDGHRWFLSLRIIEKILKTVGVDNWEKLPGKHIRVRAKDFGVTAIAHILKDNWLNFSEFLESEKEPG